MASRKFFGLPLLLIGLLIVSAGCTGGKSRRQRAKNKYPAKVGDTVRIQECRPVSKMKRWEVIAGAE